jgi:hypothetical protein
MGCPTRLADEEVEPDEREKSEALCFENQMGVTAASVLKELGLTRYIPAFEAHGINDVPVPAAIHETDFCAMGVKLGHRRKINRALFRLAGGLDDEPLSSIEPT